MNCETCGQSIGSAIAAMEYDEDGRCGSCWAMGLIPCELVEEGTE